MQEIEGGGSPNKLPIRMAEVPDHEILDGFIQSASCVTRR